MVNTAKSAYEMQFVRASRDVPGMAIWGAQAEGKHKFFAWLLLQSRILTKDRLAARGWQGNSSCSLCNLHEETAEHLILSCPFAQQVWSKVNDWLHGVLPFQGFDFQLEDCWRANLQNMSKHEQKIKAAVLMYVAWNISKERNRRIFESKAMTAADVLREVKLEIGLR
ncbi:putative ribonuclease H protein [Panicum miliaceum]|uniref:Ribonuclease H protein n=1 Tax=Panicum miliaceum TaxID=4540 RepID=A0A3L6RR91_PANMI|nr:putative ribonuclease H protein [Panicum miliaceum]